jgi:hypothetical protein
MSKEEIIEGNKLIATFLDYKFGYYETFSDISSGDDLNYSWKKEIIPITYKEQLPSDKGLEYRYDRHDRWKYQKYYDEYNSELNYNLNYEKDWNLLMGIIDKIESLEFVTDIQIQKTLSPINTCACLICNKNLEIIEESNIKIETVYKAIIRFIKWYNNQSK